MMRAPNIVLAAFGAGNGSPQNLLIESLAQQLETILVGSRVRACFAYGEPSHDKVLGSLNDIDWAGRTNNSSQFDTARVIPMLACDGVYAIKLRERVLSSIKNKPTGEVGMPLGTHQAFQDAAADYISYQLSNHNIDLANAKLVVLGHGTTVHPGSNLATTALADVVAKRTGVATQVAFLDEAPFIADVVRDSGTSAQVVVFPFMFGGGNHVMNDLPAHIRSGRNAGGLSESQIVLLEPMGGQQTLLRALEDIVRQSRPGRRQISVGARPSALSYEQVKLFARHVAPHGVDVRFVAIETPGDRDRVTPIEAFGSQDLFTSDIDHAVAAGLVDVAIHSLKDVPHTLGAQLVQAAVLPRGSTGDVLVSAGGKKLSELQNDVRIGTSCARRSLQLLKLRPDLQIVSIRGTVEQRIALVDKGELDGVVLASAGLERLRLNSRIAQWFEHDSVVPAPAQGAIAVVCRADSSLLSVLARINDIATGAAVIAERTFQRLIEEQTNMVAAAVASVVVNHVPNISEANISLFARTIRPADREVLDIRIAGSDPAAVGQEAAMLLLAG